MGRVIYQKNPIIETILQIRFPKILDLNNNDPVTFQEEINSIYPKYQLTLEQHQEISLQSENELTTPSIVKGQVIKNHAFISRDGVYKINLTSEFISISTCAYTQWEDLLDMFDTPFSAFIKIYKPLFFERIGLRYIDAFSREKLSLVGTSWDELIQPAWLGAYAIEKDEKKVKNSGLDVEYLLDNNESRVKIHAGIGRLNESLENVFVFDVDLIHISTIEVKETAEIENYLHENGKRLLDSFITEKLHDAMKPREI